MNKILPVKEKLSNETKVNLNVIVADLDWQTFEIISQIKKDFNLINLSSEFAVSFMLEYEKVDVLILSPKISNIEEISRKAIKKKTTVYIIGKDLRYPLEVKEIENLLLKQLELKLIKESESKGKAIKNSFIKLFKSRNFISGKSESINSKIQNKDYFPETEVFVEKNNIKKENVTENNIHENTKAIKQKIIIFTKAKGGVGSTILSIFLAYAFRKMKTLLIDLNFSEGGSDVGYYLNIPKSPNMIVFTEGYNRTAMDNAIIKVAENFDLLQPPPTYELSKKMDLQDIYNLVDIAKRKYHLIIFDLPNIINEMYLGVLDIADLVIMISDSTLGSIGRLISINNRFIYEDLEKILVINRTRNGSELAYLKSQFGHFFNLEELIFIEESNYLNGRTDFSNFNFDTLKSFENLTNKVLDLLTYD